MNVGSILNNDSPPSDNDTGTAPAAAKRPGFNSQQRHSLVNLLNDPAPAPVSAPPVVAQQAPPPPPPPVKEEEEEEEPSEVQNSPVLSAAPTSDASEDHKVQGTPSPTLMKRNSIANITNDRDVDITTGESTLNISHKSFLDDADTSSELDQQPGKSTTATTSHEQLDKLSESTDEQPEPKASGTPQRKTSAPEAKEKQPEEATTTTTSSKPTKVTPNKPKRYTTPPIWAQDCGPGAFNGYRQHAGANSGAHTGANGTDFDSNGSAAASGGAAMSVLSSKPLFNPSHTESVDLECSITGVIPPPSVTRTIAEWIYANFTEVPDDMRQYVELELKFGTIIDKRASHRIDINVSTECIFTDTSNTYFDVGVHEVGWSDMCKFLDDLEKSYQEDLRKTQGQGPSSKPKRKFNNLESDITDTFYQIINRNEQPKTIRISKDNQLSPPRYTAINKQRISDLFIHNPSSMYDLRLSLSSENPIPDADIESILKKQQPTLTRIKKRSSWSHRPTVTRFDMTRVLKPRESKNKAGKKIVEQDQSFEVELEIDTSELFTGFDKFKSGSDAVRFEELVEIFVNNARCLNNRVTKLASK